MRDALRRTDARIRPSRQMVHARSDDLEVRMDLAWNRHLHPKVLEQLALDSSHSVRMLLFGVRELPRDLIELVAAKYPEDIDTLARNEAAPARFKDRARALEVRLSRAYFGRYCRELKMTRATKAKLKRLLLIERDIDVRLGDLRAVAEGDESASRLGVGIAYAVCLGLTSAAMITVIRIKRRAGP